MDVYCTFPGLCTVGAKNSARANSLSSDIKENVWVWHSEGTELYMDKGEIIRFKVENEKFTDQTPVNPMAAKAEVESVSSGAEGEEAKELAERQAAELHKEPPYQINVSEVIDSRKGDDGLICYRRHVARRGWGWWLGGKGKSAIAYMKEK